MAMTCSSSGQDHRAGGLIQDGAHDGPVFWLEVAPAYQHDAGILVVCHELEDDGVAGSTLHMDVRRDAERISGGSGGEVIVHLVHPRRPLMLRLVDIVGNVQATELPLGLRVPGRIHNEENVKRASEP